MYGVNVRDLDSLAIDRPTAEATLEAARAAGRRPLLGLSGVETPADAGRLWTRGADGILVGTAVARATDPRVFLDSLRRPKSEVGP
jgi:indole-3-glycerol phosphate synthase